MAQPKIGRKIVKQDVDTKVQLSFSSFGLRLGKLEFCILGNGGKIFAEIMKEVWGVLHEKLLKKCFRKNGKI